MLDKLEQAPLLRPWKTQRGASGYYEVISGSGVWVCAGATKEDAGYIAAAANAAPALVTVARAAERFAGLGLAYEYTGEEPEPGGPDECPGIAEAGGPCHWCELRVALTALEEAAS